MLTHVHPFSTTWNLSLIQFQIFPQSSWNNLSGHMQRFPIQAYGLSPSHQVIFQIVLQEFKLNLYSAFVNLTLSMFPISSNSCLLCNEKWRDIPSRLHPNPAKHPHSFQRSLATGDGFENLLAVLDDPDRFLGLVLVSKCQVEADWSQLKAEHTSKIKFKINIWSKCSYSVSILVCVYTQLNMYIL